MEARDSNGCWNYCPNDSKCPDNDENYIQCPGGTDFNSCIIPRGKNYFIQILMHFHFDVLKKIHQSFRKLHLKE